MEQKSVVLSKMKVSTHTNFVCLTEEEEEEKEEEEEERWRIAIFCMSL